MDVKGRKAGTAGNQDGFCGLAGSQFIELVLPPCKAVWLLFCQIFKEQINRILIILVLLGHLHGVEHFQQRSKILFLSRGFVVQIGNQRGQQKPFRLVPERIAALTFTFGVGHKGRDQLQNILFLVDICERIVAHGLVKIYGVHRPDFISVLQQGKAAFLNETAFWVSHHE